MFLREFEASEASGNIYRGDRFVMLTDGLLEPLQAEQLIGTMDPIIHLLKQLGSLSSSEAVEKICHIVRTSEFYTLYNDDMTITIVDCDKF